LPASVAACRIILDETDAACHAALSRAGDQTLLYISAQKLFEERVDCPVCGSTDVQDIFSKPYVGSEIGDILRGRYERTGRSPSFDDRFAEKDYVICECKTCRAYYQRFAPVADLAVEYYSEWISEHGRPQWPFSEYTHRINEALVLTSFLLKHTGKKSPAELSILDFGVGRGLFALAMRACGCRVSAIDLSTPREDEARRNGLAIAKHEDIPGSEFDFINTEQVFEHLTHPLDTARHLVQGLATGGVLKISVPYAGWLEKGPLFFDWKASKYGKGSIMPLHPMEHLNYYRRPSLQIMMRQQGCREVQMSALDELNYAFNWKGARNIAKNLARPVVRKNFRNYLLFSKGVGV
jgi:2-polyprenyl-3-methyl-5-hydroxy-6-metoxy-1,4-benzoquinol methylase